MSTIGDRADILYQSFTKGAFANNSRTLEVLQATSYNLAGRSRLSVDQYDEWHIWEDRRSLGGISMIAAFDLAFGSHYLCTFGYKESYNLNGLVD